jgi:hypothetical protein
MPRHFVPVWVCKGDAAISPVVRPDFSYGNKKFMTVEFAIGTC